MIQAAHDQIITDFTPKLAQNSIKRNISLTKPKDQTWASQSKTQSR